MANKVFFSLILNFKKNDGLDNHFQEINYMFDDLEILDF